MVSVKNLVKQLDYCDANVSMSNQSTICLAQNKAIAEREREAVLIFSTGVDDASPLEATICFSLTEVKRTSLLLLHIIYENIFL